jgi:hypothetical protein
MPMRAYVIEAFVFAAFFWVPAEAGARNGGRPPDFVPADHIPAGVLSPYPPLS